MIASLALGYTWRAPESNFDESVAWRFCDVLLTNAAVRARVSEQLSCETISDDFLRAAQRVGSLEAAQALAARAWRHDGRPRKERLQLQAAASATHDGAFPDEKLPPSQVDLPAATLLSPRDAQACSAAAQWLLPTVLKLDADLGPKAAEVPVALRRLEGRWHGKDPKDQTVDRTLGAAEVGEMWAVRSRGYHALTADGVPGNVSSARADFEVTARAGDGHATFNLGYMYLMGVGVERDESEAVRLFEQAAALGVTPAWNALGVAYFNGFGVPRDTVKAVACLRRAVQEGDPEAMTNLAAAILGGETTRQADGRLGVLGQGEFTEALSLLETSALRGRRGALLQLGALLVGAPRTYISPPGGDHHRKHDGQDDCPRGVALLRLLLEMWGPCADSLAAALRAWKAGDGTQALHLYLRAAAMGSSVGMANAAHLLLRLSDADAVADAQLARPESRATLARSLLREAHELGNTDASLALADLIYDEAKLRGAEDDDDGFAKALELYEQVNDRVQDPESLYAAGYMYRHGIGTPRDLDKAARLFTSLAEAEPLPGVLAQFGVGVQQMVDWLAESIGL